MDKTYDDYMSNICEEDMYNHGFVDGYCWLYVLILTNKEFAHEIVVQFGPIKKDRNYISFCARKLIHFKIIQEMPDDHLKRLYWWCFYGKKYR